MFLFHSALIVSAGDRGQRVQGGSRPPGPGTCPGGAAGRRMDRGRQQGPPASRGPDYFSGAAGRRGRVHFDGRQGRGAHGRRGQDRAHAYTREHKTRVRPLPLKKIFLFPVGEYLARKTGVFPHGPFFCAMLFTSQGKRPAGDGGKPPKKFPEKNFEKGLTNGVHRDNMGTVDGVHRTQTTNDRRPTPHEKLHRNQTSAPPGNK